MNPIEPSSPFFSKQKNGMSAFSLIELLAVMAIISVLATVVTPAVSTIFQGRSVANAVDLVSNSAAVARQTAISKGRPVALVISRQAGTGLKDAQGVLLLAFDATTGWTAISPWNRLPVNVRAEVYSRDGVVSFHDGQGGGSIAANLPVKFDGANAPYDYVIFQPDGSMDAPASGPALTFRRLNSSNSNSDYFLVLQSDSGRSKIIDN